MAAIHGMFICCPARVTSVTLAVSSVSVTGVLRRQSLRRSGLATLPSVGAIA